jgi:hypothetical protein
MKVTCLRSFSPFVPTFNFFFVFFFLKHRHVAGVCNWNYTFLSMVDIVGAHGFGLFTYLYSTDRETASLVLLTSI